MLQVIRLIRRRQLKDLLLGGALLLAMVGLAAAPTQAADGVREGLKLCFQVLIPSLFPFFILSSLVIRLGLAAQLGRAAEPLMRPLFRLSGSCAAAVVLGFIGGYPVGARTAITLYKEGMCSKTEAERLLAFCNNSGPAFILGVVGAGIFGNSRIGLLLYTTHAAASLLTGFLFRFYGRHDRGAGKRQRTPIAAISVPTAFTEAVTGALQSTLGICSFVTFFAVVLRLLSYWGIVPALASLLTRLGVHPDWAPRLVAGLLELSSGVTSLTGAGGGAGQLSMAAFMLGWAGISVHCQVLSFLVDSGLSGRIYLAGKLCHGLLAAAMTWLLGRRLLPAEPVAGYLRDQVESIALLDFSTALVLSLAAAFLCWIALVSISLFWIRKKGGKTTQHRI